jgi:FG-GAP repeat
MAHTERVAMATVLGASVVIGLLVGLAAATGPISATVVGPPPPIPLHAPIELTSSAPLSNGQFGIATAVAKGNVAIGAPFETDAGFLMGGNVYVFNGATGHPIATIASPHPKLTGFFGFSVAMSGTTLVVGAPNETAGTYEDAGNAYVYTISGTTVTLKCTLVDPTPLAGAPNQIGGAFGYSVAISGGGTVIVGAPGETVSGMLQAGNAYVYTSSCGLLSSLTTLNPVEYGVYGWSVAFSGTTAYIGAPEENDGGHVYMVLKATSAAADRTTYVLSSPNAQPDYGQFGYSVSASAAYLVVGAPFENVSSVFEAGNAYLYNDSSGLLLSQLVNPNPQDSGDFGQSVAVSGLDVVVGAPYDSAFGTVSAGNVTVFNATTGGILTTLTSPNFVGGGTFGASVAADTASIVVGAPNENTATVADAGHAYIY